MGFGGLSAPQERFDDKVEIITESGCHIWLGCVTRQGYGQLWFNGKVRYTHRLSYEWNHGEIPEGLMVLHSCDTRCCVNPNHLRVGTVKDNAEDRMARGRDYNTNKTHCINSHEYTPENTYKRPNTEYKECRKCRREKR